MRYQEKQKEGKALILKKQKLIRIKDREEVEWEVLICYLSDNLASDLRDEKQLNKAHREAASSRKKKETNKYKDNKKQFSKCPPFQKHCNL